MNKKTSAIPKGFRRVTHIDQPEGWSQKTLFSGDAITASWLKNRTMIILEKTTVWIGTEKTDDNEG